MKADEATLTKLVEIWRATKSPEVASVARRLSLALESAEATALRGQRKIKQADWMAFAESANMVDRGAAFATISNAKSADVKARVIYTDNWDADPRLADALHEIVREVPWVSTSSRVVWTQIFKRMISLSDPRTIEIAGRFDPASLGSGWDGPGQYLQSRLEKVVEKITPASGRALSDEEAALSSSVASSLPAENEQSTDELIAAALADPLKHELRIVVADALQDRGDVRGELIMLQAQVEQGSADKATTKRIKAILKSHRRELLGPLADVVLVKGLEFELGFASVAEVKEVVHQNKIEAALASPLAASIHRLTGPGALLIRPELRGLRHAVVDREVEAVFACERALPFVSLQTWARDWELASLERVAALPNLTSLATASMEKLVPKILETAIAKQVSTLTLLGVQGSSFGDHAAQLQSLAESKVERFVAEAHQERSDLDHYQLKLALCRSSPSQSWTEAELEIELPSKNWLGKTPGWTVWLGQCLRSVSPSIDRLTISLRRPLKGENREFVTNVVAKNWSTPVEIPK